MGELVAPFPYFGGKSRAADQVWEALGEVKNYVEARCSGQSQSFGCRPVRFVALFVDQFFSCLARVRAATHLSWKATRCIDRWSALLSSSRLSGVSIESNFVIRLIVERLQISVMLSASISLSSFLVV